MGLQFCAAPAADMAHTMSATRAGALKVTTYDIAHTMHAHPLLSADSITKSYAGVCALAGVSFDLFPGEVHALVGENGAGKSTLIKVMTGAVAPDSGTLSISGEVHRSMSPATARALGVAPSISSHRSFHV